MKKLKVPTPNYIDSHFLNKLRARGAALFITKISERLYAASRAIPHSYVEISVCNHEITENTYLLRPIACEREHALIVPYGE
jgi:hypothetical protein